MAVPFVNLITYTWFTLGSIFFTDLLFKTEILFFLTLIGTGLFVSFSVVAYCVYAPMIEDCFKEQDRAMIKEEEVTYEKKYVDLIEKYDKTMECTDEEVIEISKKRKCVNDKTPMGDVLMYYDSDNKHFVYHAHSSSIPYRFLDAVCRKFVIEYRCVRLYCNVEEDVKKIEEKREQEKEEKIKLEEEKDKLRVQESVEELEKQLEEDNTRAEQEDNVFASFKSYNQKKNSGGITTSAVTTLDKQIDTNNEDVILKERINSYRFGGKMHEFVDLEKEPTSTEKKIDFATFKQMSENKKSL